MNIYEITIPIVAILSTFTFLTVSVYLYFSSRHNERMALIERGLDASILRVDKRGNRALKFGLLFVMVGIGLVFGDAFYRIGLLSEEVSYFSMIFLMGGLALLLYHFYLTKKEKVEDEI